MHAGLARRSPEQLDQPLLEVLLGPVQVVQVGKHLLVVFLPVCHLLAQSAVIFLELCGGFFKFLLGPEEQWQIFLMSRDLWAHLAANVAALTGLLSHG